MQLSYLDSFYWFCALAGSALILLQLFFSSLTEHGFDEMHPQGSECGKLKWLSKQKLSGFLMLFGFTALTCSYQFHYNVWISFIVASGAGLLVVAILNGILKGARRLCSPGANFKVEDTLHQKGVVYQRIAKGGKGKISLAVHQISYELEAISLDGEEIDSFLPIQVVKITQDGLPAVVKIKGDI